MERKARAHASRKFNHPLPAPSLMRTLGRRAVVTLRPIGLSRRTLALRFRTRAARVALSRCDAFLDHDDLRLIEGHGFDHLSIVQLFGLDCDSAASVQPLGFSHGDASEAGQRVSYSVSELYFHFIVSLVSAP